MPCNGGTENVVMKEVGLQLHTVRDHIETLDDLRNAVFKIKECGYSSIHTSGASKIKDVESAKFFKKCVDDAGIGICGTHYSWKSIVEDIEDTMRVHDVLETKNVGIGSMPAIAKTSYEEFCKFVDTMNAAAKKLGENGFKLTYHNHSFDFLKFNGKTMMDYMIERFDEDNITFVLDTYWVQHAGYDVRKMMERLAGRIDILHLKDMGAWGGEDGKSPYITEIGNGNLNFDDIIPLGDKIGVKYFVVEQDIGYTTGDSFESIKQSYDYLKNNFIK